MVKKFGSKVTPISPRSPEATEGRTKKLFGKSAPFLKIFISPVRWRIKIRPSGAISKPDGPSSPDPTTSEVWKFAGGAA